MTRTLNKSLLKLAVVAAGVLCVVPALADDYKIGFVGDNEPTKGDFRLYWRGDQGNTKNAEFRKGGNGDTFSIEKVGPDRYYISFTGDQLPTKGKHCLFWRGDRGTTKNAEFRKSERGDIFFIESAGNGVYRIGFDAGNGGETSGKHYLFWSGDPGNTKNAEFRKGNSGDTFYLQKAF